jgi:hypothetical protein
MTSRLVFIVAIAVALGLTHVARAQVLFSDNFDTTTAASYYVNVAANNPGNSAATFLFNYSALGIPPAPNNPVSNPTGTVGVKLEANFTQLSGTNGIASGVSISPILGTALPANYKLRFDVWENFNGPLDGTGTGSTQHSGAGIGTDGTTSQYPGTSVQGVTFAATGDGGAAQDYRAYKGSTTQLTGTQGFVAVADPNDPRSHFNGYYSSFGNKTAPPEQTAINPTTQTGTTQAGTQGFAWHTWDVTKDGNTVTWAIDNLTIANIDVTGQTFPGTNFFVGQFDFFASAVDPSLRQFLFAVVDNVQVTAIAVPEPGTLALAGLAVPALFRLRRRRPA